MGHGGRCINIAAANTDDLRTTQKFNNVVLRIKVQEVNISRIKETRNTERTTYEAGEYEILFTKETGDGEEKKRKYHQRG